MENRRVPARSPLKVAVGVTIALVALSSLIALLGLQAVVANQHDPNANIIGFGALFTAIGVALFTTWRYFEAGIVLGLLGVPVMVAGYGFFGGGVTQLLLPRVNYFTVWATDLGMIAVAALVVFVLNALIKTRRSTSTSKKPKVMRTSVEQTFFTQDCQEFFVPVIVGVSMAILLVGLLT